MRNNRLFRRVYRGFEAHDSTQAAAPVLIGRTTRSPHRQLPLERFILAPPLKVEKMDRAMQKKHGCAQRCRFSGTALHFKPHGMPIALRYRYIARVDRLAGRRPGPRRAPSLDGLESIRSSVAVRCNRGFMRARE